MTGARSVAAVVAVGLLAACGGDGQGGVARIEEAIASAVVEAVALDDDEVAVTCPDDASLDEGAELTCDVAVGGADAQAVPFSIDLERRVVLAAAVIPTAAAEAHVAEELAGDQEVACGDGALLVGAVGSTFRCEARGDDTAEQVVEVSISSLDGAVRVRLVPASSDP